MQSNASENVDTNFVGLLSNETERAAIEHRYAERVAAAAKEIVDARRKMQAEADAKAAAAAALAALREAAKRAAGDNAAAAKPAEWHQVRLFVSRSISAFISCFATLYVLACWSQQYHYR
jgi:hypothetical protein